MNKDFIPHQIGLTLPQVKKMVQGMPITLAHHQMGSGAGDFVVMLHPQNARKMLTSYSKGKGMRLHLNPHELETSITHGRGIGSVAHKVYSGAKHIVANPVISTIAKKGLHYGAKAIGTAVGAYFDNPDAGSMVGDALGSMGEIAIDDNRANIKNPKKVVVETLKKDIKKLPAEVQPVATQALNGIIKKKHRGEGIMDDKFSLNDASNFFRNDVAHLFGKGTRLADQKFSINEAGNFLRNDVPHMFGKGTPLLDQKFSINEAGDFFKGLKGKGVKKGSEEMRERMAKLRSMRKGKGIIDDIKNAFSPNGAVVKGLKTAGHYIIPAATGALGGLAGAALTENPMGGIAGSALGKFAGDQINKSIGIGMKRPRGRPKKGTGAKMSAPFQNAMKMNYDGLVLGGISGDNQPISSFKTNPKVKPSSTEMTLSPYQSMSSPAMNPFIPTYYTEAGGMGSGYGGRGVKGKGLYGGGLY